VTALAAHLTPEHAMFRETCRRFFEKEVVPFHRTWEEEGMVPRALWRRAGEQGLLGMTMPEAYGGAGGDFLYSMILIEEQGRALIMAARGRRRRGFPRPARASSSRRSP
jgi:acyl-CoA dehydrogenase